jgi:hypothetical protein
MRLLLVLFAMGAAATAAGAAPSNASTSVLHVGSCDACAHATLHSARDAIRRRRLAQGVHATNQSASVAPVRVLVHPGTYAPLVLDNPTLDSHVAYEGVADDSTRDPPLISAGTRIPKAAWAAAPAADGFVAGVVVANITALGLSPGGPLPETGTTCCDICDQETQLTAQLFHLEPGIVSQPLLARYPNAGTSSGLFD